MFIEVDTLPDGANSDNEVPAMILCGPGCMIVPHKERGVIKDRTKLIFPDGRAIVLAHSMIYMRELIMGALGRAGLASDLDRQLGATGKQ